MADHAPFHVQLDEHLRRRFWTAGDLLNAFRAPRGRRGEAGSSCSIPLCTEELQTILAGNLAPTQSLGERIANLIIGTPDCLDANQLREWEALVGAAYVAECHGRRQQLPYTHGVLGDLRPSIYAQTIDQQSSRQAMVEEQKRQRLLARLIELEEEQARRASRHPLNGKNGKAATARPLFESGKRKTKRTVGAPTPTLARIDRARRTPPSQWEAAATASLAFIPEQARRADPNQEVSLLHVIGRSFAAGYSFSHFLNSLLVAWRSETPNARGKRQDRMSPEQLGAYIGQSNGSRYASDPAKQDWFQRHQGPGVTGSSLRNYLAGNSERPLRECVQKLIWAFTVAGEIQIPVEQRIWRMVAGAYPLAGTDPRGTETHLVGLAKSPIDVALDRGDRGSLLRALLDHCGMPVTRIAELTDVHESLFQQWMRDGQTRRIENRQRAARIVDLCNPPDLARWPLTPELVAIQNERAINLLTTNASSFAEALRAAQECHIPAEYGLDEEGEKTYRAAYLLRHVFGRDSLSNLTGPEVGRMLAAQGLGDRQVFKHLREGVRDGGKKAARRASLEQARFLASLLEQVPGGLDDEQRQRFIECVACVDLKVLANLPTPQQLLRQVAAPKSTFSIRQMTREIMRRRGGLVRFSGEVGVCQQTIRSFVGHAGHYLHHAVARRIAKRGMGFASRSEEHRQFVVMSTAAWKERGKHCPVHLSSIAADYADRLQQATSIKQMRTIRADAMGSLLSQAALSPKELARALGVTPAVVAGWTSPRGGHFTSPTALDRFLRRMEYEAEQIEFVEETFGTSPVAPCFPLPSRSVSQTQ